MKEYYAELSIEIYEGDIVISCVPYKRRALFTGHKVEVAQHAESRNYPHPKKQCFKNHRKQTSLVLHLGMHEEYIYAQ